MHFIPSFLRDELFRISTTPVTILSLLIFVFGILATLLLARVARKGVSAFLSTQRSAPPGVAYAMGRITQYVVSTAGILVSLDTLGVDLGTLAAFGAVLSVGIGFGLQTITHNFISGIILLIERPVQKGDFVVVGDIVGTVVDIEMRATKVMTRDGVAMIVPNSEFISATVVNQTHPTSRKRVQIRVGVAYGSDTAAVRDVLVALALDHPKVLHDPPPAVFFRNFGDSTLDFDLAFWLEHPAPEPIVASDLRFAIDRVFREKNIEIPFPQREVRLKGGVGEAAPLFKA
jgi:small-conductance mechanosensitive channel